MKASCNCTITLSKNEHSFFRKRLLMVSKTVKIDQAIHQYILGLLCHLPKKRVDLIFANSPHTIFSSLKLYKSPDKFIMVVSQLCLGMKRIR